MKTKLLPIFTYLLLFLSRGFCFGESPIGFALPPEIFNLIKQNLRPFENVSFEFMTELEDQKTRKWELEGRHRIIVDFSRGFYKLSSVRKTAGIKHCSFVERGWDGKYAIRVEKDMRFTSDLRFTGIRSDKNVLVTVSSRTRKYLLAYLCEFFVLYEGKRFDESLYSTISTPNMRGFVFLPKSKNEISLSLGRSQEVIFDRKNGSMLGWIKRSRMLGGGEFDMENHKVEKVENKDGCFFPAQVVSTHKNSKGEISLRRRTTLAPNTLSINEKIAPGAFRPKIPVRASLLNNIENTHRVVTELDPLLDREGFQKQMDTFVDELRKDLKR